MPLKCCSQSAPRAAITGLDPWAGFDPGPALILELGTRAQAILAALLLAAGQAGACPLSAYGINSPIEELCPFKDGLAQIRVGGKWGFVDRAGKVAIAPQFDDVEPFSQGYATAGLGELKGVIDRSGAWVVPPQFQQIGNFSDGLAPASRTWHAADYIDRAGKWVIAPRFASSEPFVGAVALVSMHGRGYALIDRQGRIVKHLPPGIEIQSDASRAPLLHAATQAAPLLVHLDGRRRHFRPGTDIEAYKERHAIAMDVEAPPRHAKGANGLNTVRAAKKGALWGLVDAKGAWVTPPVLDLEPRPFIHQGKCLAGLAASTSSIRSRRALTSMPGSPRAASWWPVGRASAASRLTLRRAC